MSALPALPAHVRTAAPHDVWAAWSLGPALLIALVAWWYARGRRRLEPGSGPSGHVVHGRPIAFAAGLAVLAIALASPLDALAGALFSAHMVQHLALTLVAPPLLVAGAPLVPLAGAPHPGRRRLLRALRRRLVSGAVLRPGPAWVLAASLLQAATLWAWHLPVLYDAAVARHDIHVVEHATLLGAALVFWWVIAGHGHRAEPGLGIVAGFVAALQSGALAALLTFASRPWYASHQATAPAWGLGPLDDQQLAGVLMWVGGGLVYALAGGLLFLSWLATSPATPSLPSGDNASELRT